MLEVEQKSVHWCYRCGHDREEHRKMIRVATRETVYIDCLRPVGEKTAVLAIKWIHVCQCSEFLDKEHVKGVNLPGK